MLTAQTVECNKFALAKARVEHCQKIRQSQELRQRDTVRMTDSRQIQAVAIVLLLGKLRNYVIHLTVFSIEEMDSDFIAVTRQCYTMPYSGSGNDIDMDGSFQGTAGGGGGSGGVGVNRGVDYHTVIGHFKDFFMYLPVMMTTIKETMSGFPKFAEGMRILSGKGRVDGEDCKCSQNSLPAGTSSEVLDNTSRFG